MKKIATYISIVIGLVLFSLNYINYSNSISAFNSDNTSLNQKNLQIEEADETLDISNTNLPSLFEAILNLL